MQDSMTGIMHPLPTEFFKDVPVADNPLMPGQPKFQDGKELRDAIQKACDTVQPDRSRQGPVFMVGEVLEIRGGKFLITKIEPGHLKLKSLPRDYEA